MEELKSNREGAIYKDGNAVVRPINPWTKSTHLFLNHLSMKGVLGVPKVLEFDSKSEKLQYIDGETTDFPLEGEFSKEGALISAAKLLREIHNCSIDFVKSHNVKAMVWMLPAVEPLEVVCHGDFAPYNCAFIDGKVSGVFDFDTAHPAPRIWDLAYAIYTWAPFQSDGHLNKVPLSDQIDRARLFCDIYGATDIQRKELPAMMIKRLRALVEFMRIEAKKGNVQFIENIDGGHHCAYLADIEYISSQEGMIIHGLLVN
ncbi:MAG: aminoglycoside phosphotransferase family protein [Saccharospirillum sp.]|uniref:aminoglycoside phosphotransferase family protein n=1 Tax=Saccharospirillum sp. TaxID=2033801 RepID=UPI00329986A6